MRGILESGNVCIRASLQQMLSLPTNKLMHLQSSRFVLSAFLASLFLSLWLGHCPSLKNSGGKLRVQSQSINGQQLGEP
jgi:hypothetical protein